jgi:hypothetical protein
VVSSSEVFILQAAAHGVIIEQTVLFYTHCHMLVCANEQAILPRPRCPALLRDDVHCYHRLVRRDRCGVGPLGLLNWDVTVWSISGHAKTELTTVSWSCEGMQNVIHIGGPRGRVY